MSVPKSEFPIKLSTKPLFDFLWSQIFVTPRYPKHSFSGQTVIVTGANTGLGLDASRHFYRLGCAKLILAVRSISKGERAKEDIINSAKERSDVDAIEIWQLDMSSTESTLAFAARARSELPRVDAVVENAGVSGVYWSMVEGYEQCVQVNVLNTFLLALALLPKLQQTKAEFPASSPHLTIVSSEAHHLTKFGEINAPDLYTRLNDEGSYDEVSRYQISKLLEVLLIRELVSRLRSTKTPQQSPTTTPPVIINLVNPGLCKSDLNRDSDMSSLGARLFLSLSRTTEVGSRTLVLAASAGPESHGEFQSDGKNQNVEAWIYSDVGARAQKKVFEQTMKIMESRKPGIGASVGV